MIEAMVVIAVVAVIIVVEVIMHRRRQEDMCWKRWNKEQGYKQFCASLYREDYLLCRSQQNFKPELFSAQVGDWYLEIHGIVDAKPISISYQHKYCLDGCCWVYIRGTASLVVGDQELSLAAAEEFVTQHWKLLKNFAEMTSYEKEALKETLDGPKKLEALLKDKKEQEVKALAEKRAQQKKDEEDRAKKERIQQELKVLS